MHYSGRIVTSPKVTLTDECQTVLFDFLAALQIYAVCSSKHTHSVPI